MDKADPARSADLLREGGAGRPSTAMDGGTGAAPRLPSDRERASDGALPLSAERACEGGSERLLSADRERGGNAGLIPGMEAGVGLAFWAALS
ncbi:hypothetical protein AKI39_19970 [Bordetella sp. H567]|nr:hypothetical protein AKI39_19970 [Bordetella sp. H567]